MNTMETVAKEQALAHAKERADNWVSVYVRPLRNVPLEVRLVKARGEDTISVEAKVSLGDEQKGSLIEYEKKVNEWYQYFLSLNQ